MKTAVQETSLSAYRIAVEPKLGEKQAVVLAAFTPQNGMTNQELAAYLGWPINCVTPRVFELRAMGLVREHCRRKDMTTGRRSICWERVPQNGKLF